MIIVSTILVATFALVGASFDPASKAKVGNAAAKFEQNVCNTLKNCGGSK
jgi:hypothetical protein